MRAFLPALLRLMTGGGAGAIASASIVSGVASAEVAAGLIFAGVRPLSDLGSDASVIIAPALVGGAVGLAAGVPVGALVGLFQRRLRWTHAAAIGVAGHLVIGLGFAAWLGRVAALGPLWAVLPLLLAGLATGLLAHRLDGGRPAHGARPTARNK